MQVLPCRYCGAPTVMKRVGHKVYQILNEDGSLHTCKEAERAKAIPVIFGTELDTACSPLSPAQVLEELQGFDQGLLATMGNGSKRRYHALTAAIEVLKLVTRE